MIFEGADKTAKSTIARELAARLGIPYFQSSLDREWLLSGEFPTRYEPAMRYLADFVRQTRVEAVIDRSYPSEYAYSRALGRETMKSSRMEELDCAWLAMGAVIVYCERENAREDEHVARAVQLRVKAFYEHFLGDVTRLPVLRLATDDEDLERECREVARFLRRQWEVGEGESLR